MSPVKCWRRDADPVPMAVDSLDTLHRERLPSLTRAAQARHRLR